MWAGDKNEKESDCLAVVDVRRESRTYGDVLATAPVGMTGTLPHHLEYSLPGAGQTLYANGHHHEQIFRFDVADAEHPKFVGTADRAPTLRYPHDFVRLPDKASTADTSLKEPMRAYAFAVLPAIDRFVVTSAPMMEDHSADAIQGDRHGDKTRVA